MRYQKAVAITFMTLVLIISSSCTQTEQQNFEAGISSVSQKLAYEARLAAHKASYRLDPEQFIIQVVHSMCNLSNRYDYIIDAMGADPFTCVSYSELVAKYHNGELSADYLADFDAEQYRAECRDAFNPQRMTDWTEARAKFDALFASL